MEAPAARTADPLGPFTINHMSPAAFVVGGEDVTEPIGLSPLPEFPGYERMLDAPVPSATGVYMHAVDTPEPGAELRVLAHGAGATGRVVFASRSVTAVPADGVSWTRTTSPDGLPTFVFSLAPEAELVFEVSNIDLPVFVRDFSQQAYVGADAVPSAGPDFSLELRDRHSYSAADFDGDGERDLFIAGGGYGGAIERYARWARDELLLARRDGFVRGGAPPKGICRGRASAAPDANRDGLPDVFVDCEGAEPRLHLNTGEPGVWQTRELDVDGSGYRWLNVDRDRPIELLAFSDTAMTVYEGGVEREYSVPLRGAPAGTPAVGDLLGRGRPQILVSSPAGSTLIDRRRALDPARYGLPGTGYAAAIVDVDNDGDRDVHLAPQGLYLRGKGTRLRAAGALEITAPYVALNWADLDGDGRRDPLALSGKGPFSPAKRILRWRNRSRAGNWIAVDSASLQLGDRIEVRAGGESQVGWVGESEGSRWSDTHRRVYFGVGHARRARVLVRPARGKAERFRVRAGRVLDPAR
jgi:hypothetical protein